MPRRPKDNPNWGGLREGAGRPKGEETQFIGVRMPVSLLDKIDKQPGTRSENIIKAVRKYFC